MAFRPPRNSRATRRAHAGTRARRVAAAVTVAVAALVLVPLTTATTPASAETSFVFNGAGNGHGLGLSQYGAHGMAAAGYNSTQILTHFYTGTQVQTLPQPDGLRVLMARAGNAVVSPSGPIQFLLNGQLVTTATAGDNLIVTASGNQFVIQGRTGAFGAPNDLLLVPLSTSAPVHVSTDNPAYAPHNYGRGILVFRITSTNVLQVTIEGLPMEQYLLGIGEMPSSWEPAALESQAIAARTFANRVTTDRRASDPSRPYDLDSTADGAYIGWDKEAGAMSDRWISAVNRTPGQTVTYQGAPIMAFFSASDGGYSENSEYVFVQALPYLRGVPDPWDSYQNSYASWTRGYGQTELSTALARSADTNVGTLTDIAFFGPFGVSGRIDKAAVRLTGTGGVKQVTGARFKAVVNATFTSLSRKLPSTKIAVSGDPFGAIEVASRSPQGFRVGGWVIDPNSVDPVTIRIDVGGLSSNLAASGARPDVAAVYTSYGPNHGFDTTVAVPSGATQLCVVALNVGLGVNRTLGCWAVSANPGGSLDSVVRVPGGLQIAGWALDPDTANPVDIAATAGSEVTFLTANGSRPDVGAAFPGYGDQHGFAQVVPAAEGTYPMCITGFNIGAGANVNLGCRAVTVSFKPQGSLDVVQNAGGGNINVAGWALDPDSAGPLDVHVYVDGIRKAIVSTTASRPDIAAAFPGYGDQHGFAATIATGAGTHQICAWAVNTGAGNTNIMFGCRNITIP
jgi:SpoIID/LytB domain protein